MNSVGFGDRLRNLEIIRELGAASGTHQVMARIARVVVPEYPHHVTQRGNHGQDVFLCDADRNFYLKVLRDHCERHGARVLAWCLMTNHVHLVMVPEREDSLCKALGRTHNEYARWIQVRQRQVGHLWQNRFHSCALERRHLWEAMRYVELNPVRAGLAQQAWGWEWSSARAHITGADPHHILDLVWWREEYDPRQWTEVLEWGYRQAALTERLREATRTGRPLGGAEFVEELECRMGRRLRPHKPGPKAKAAGAAGQMSLGIA